VDKRLIIWDVESEQIKYNASLPSVVEFIEWSSCQENTLLLLLANGEIKVLDLLTKSILKLELLAGAKPCALKCHPRKEQIIAVGFQSGEICFADIQTLQTYTLKISESENGNPGSGVSDLAWDEGEDNIVVSFNDGMVVLITYEGLEEKTQVRMYYERQSVGASHIMWKGDKSGDFFTSSRKVGALRVFNVAQKSPKQIIKVGNSGVHYMQRIKGDS